MNKSAILFILSAAVGVVMMGLGIIWPLIPVYAVELGAGGFLVVPVAMALTADITPPRKLGLYMGTLNMAIMIGLGFGPAMGGIIRDTLGFNAAFYIMGGLALITSLMVAVFIPADKRQAG